MVYVVKSHNSNGKNVIYGEGSLTCVGPKKWEMQTTKWKQAETLF